MSSPRRFFPFLSWPRPGADLLRGELSAALTVAVVMIPQAVAYAALARMPLITGLYATFLPTLAAVLFSRSMRLSTGPTALSALLVGASLVGLAEPGSAQWVAMGVWLALLSGVVQLAVGVTGGSWLLNLVSSPVLAGFTQAAALLIIASQVPALLGLQGTLGTLLDSPRFELEGLGYGLGSLALFEIGKRWLPRLPMALLVLAGAAVLAANTGYASRGAVIGSLPAGLPSLYIPALPTWEQFTLLLAPALVLALVTSLEMAASAKIESQREGRRWDANQDLIGQGLAKLASAVSGAFPVSTSFSRSALTLYAGGRTGWSTLFSAGVVLLVLLFFTPALYHVPSSVLAAVVIAAVLGLLKPRLFATLWRLNRVEAVIAATTLAVTLLSAPRIYWGVLTGVVLGMAHFLYHRLHPRIIEAGLHPDGSLRDRNLWQLPPLAPATYALRMDDELDFASASALERQVLEHLALNPDVRHVCLFAQPINRIDATGVEMFGQLRRQLAARDITLHLSGLKLPVESMLRRAGELPTEDARLRLYRTDAEALSALKAEAAAVD
jgi:sulfate permease, SulP family